MRYFFRDVHAEQNYTSALCTFLLIFSQGYFLHLSYVTCQERKHKIIWAAPQQCFLRRALLENLVKSRVWKFDEESNLGMFYISGGDR